MFAACLPDKQAMPPLPLIVLRPEPGASATVARAAAAGLTAMAVPLFAAGPLPWVAPHPDNYDALLLTSANAPRFAGRQLERLRLLPSWCVGRATADAARNAGLAVAETGDGDAASLISRAASAGIRRMLWLAGAARTDIVVPAGLKVDVETVYHAAPLPVDPAQLSGPAVMLVHSKRAARRLAELVRERSGINLVAISPAVSAAAGDGWRRVEVASRPDDGEMVAIAAKLCHEAR